MYTDHIGFNIHACSCQQLPKQGNAFRRKLAVWFQRWKDVQAHHVINIKAHNASTEVRKLIHTTRQAHVSNSWPGLITSRMYTHYLTYHTQRKKREKKTSYPFKQKCTLLPPDNWHKRMLHICENTQTKENMMSNKKGTLNTILSAKKQEGGGGASRM